MALKVNRIEGLLRQLRGRIRHLPPRSLSHVITHRLGTVVRSFLVRIVRPGMINNASDEPIKKYGKITPVFRNTVENPVFRKIRRTLRRISELWALEVEMLQAVL